MAGPSGVLVVGSANLDIVVPVERLPRPGETVAGGDRLEFWGGKGANQAVAAARAGGRVRLVCLTGSDPAGAAYRKRLAAEGIDRRGLLAAEGPTGTALIVVDARGGNQIAVSPGANARLTPARLRGWLSLLDFGGAVLAQLEVPLATVRETFRHAKRRGAITILNPAPVPSATPKELLALTDVLVPNESEEAGRNRPAGSGWWTRRERGTLFAELWRCAWPRGPGWPMGCASRWRRPRFRWGERAPREGFRSGGRFSGCWAASPCGRSARVDFPQHPTYGEKL